MDIKEFYSYDSFLAYTESLVKEGKTSGMEQSAARIEFTRLNYHRMLRWNKTFKLNDDLKQKLEGLLPQTWWVITEPWCGDSAQNLPGIAKMAEASMGKVDLKIVLRDENPELMDKYLTNGGRSIPKLIALGKDDELFTWGPRPATVQQLMLDWKANPKGRSHDDFELELHTWYAKNKGRKLQEEFNDLI